MDSLPFLIWRFVFGVFPLVSRELSIWTRMAADIPDICLGEQARASLSSKRFHAQGGSIYACYAYRARHEMVRFIVAFQTISDYLDNLCDRTSYQEGIGFQQLHLSMARAVTCDETEHDDYYSHYPSHNDGGYLVALIDRCRSALGMAPTWYQVQSHVLRLVGLYTSLQVNKHLPPDVREASVKRWVDSLSPETSGLFWWEYACATGSTLGMFALAALSTEKETSSSDAQAVVDAYFPWICGLHILLDYLIDIEEDRSAGDMNFVTYYSSGDETAGRLAFFVEQAMLHCTKLPRAGFHRVVVLGLLAMYLSDRKVDESRLHSYSNAMLDAAGPSAHRLLSVCRMLRRRGLVR